MVIYLSRLVKDKGLGMVKPLIIERAVQGLTMAEESDVRKRPVSILKTLISPENCHDIIREMSHFRTLVPANDPNQPYPEGILNFHMPVSVSTKPQNSDAWFDSEFPIDFWEHRTRLHIHNYRFGDIQAPMVQQNLPTFAHQAEAILELYRSLADCPFQHGNFNGRNLFFEISHYPLGAGFIERHTHFRNIQNGQKQAMVILLSQPGVDHEKAGLVIEVGSEDLNLTSLMNGGDAVVFDMSCPHYVPTVEAPSMPTEAQGRWVMSLFYY